jgi:sulfite reductase (ferredoxin)
MNTRTLNIPLEVQREIDEFAAEVERLNRGDVPEEEFKRFRLQQGIYGQRQADVQMIRTKLSTGHVNSSQLGCLSDFADKYSNGILHVTTRQDIQFHFVKLDDVPQGLQDLADRGLTSREACGNTVRNVTACHKAGTCPGEAFDVKPYGQAVTNHLLRHTLTQNLPRKFKITLGGCNGCGLSPINDIGLNAVVREENGQQVRGFRVLIGGGLGSSPHAAQLLTEFLPTDQLLRCAQAVVQVFDKYGDKKNRNKARFKFVLDKLGLEKTKEHYEEEFQALAGKKFDPIEVPEDTIPSIPVYDVKNDFADDPGFNTWRTRNTTEQRQPGFFNVQVKLLLGDMKSSQAREIGRIASTYAASEIVMTVNQNVMIPWVRTDAMDAVYAVLKSIDLHQAGTEEIRDITCCPGSETCNLGITASRGMAAELSKDLQNGLSDSTELDHISIKASGCPNSCGQHHIASIGFHGGAKKINGILTPHYEIFLGGRVSEDKVTFGLPVIKIPAKNSGQVMKTLVENYKQEKQSGETFGDYFDRQGKAYFRQLLDALKHLPSIEESPYSYIDYGSEKAFSLDDRGQGECAGAVTDMIQDHLAEADRAHFQAQLSLEKQAFRDVVAHCRRALVFSSRALLVTEGMDFDDDMECLQKFKSLIVDMEIVPEKYAALIGRCESYPASPDANEAQLWFDETAGLVAACRKVYDKLNTDKSLRIRVDGDDHKKPAAAPVGEANSAAVKLDLLGVTCPFNYVKTKMKLETMAPGSLLEVLLDDGEPSENVPRSIQNDGHQLISLEKDNGHYTMLVKKA